MPNIQDIAKATGYSATTVSKAFNNYSDISDKAKKKILAAAKELGYFPNAQARGLKMRRSFTIGVILDELLGYGLAHPFFSMVIEAFRQAVEASGYSMIFITNELGNSNIEKYISHCNQLNVDGVFVLCIDSEEAGIQELIHSEIPTVLFDVPNEETSCVISNHYQGAYDAVTYLHDKGHSKIAHIYGTELTYAGAEQQRGFKDAMVDLNLGLEDKWIVCGGYFDLKYGRLAMQQLLEEEEHPTAVFISGDMMALGAMQVCREMDIRVPEDISLMGFDNILMLDWISPSLTTVAQDYKAIGRECCAILTKRIAHKDQRSEVRVIGTSIVERNSCQSIQR